MVFHKPLLVDPNGSGCRNAVAFHLEITLDSLQGGVPKDIPLEVRING